MNPARVPLTIHPTGIELRAFECHCGARIWPRAAYDKHAEQAHGGAAATERICVRCRRKCPLMEFVTKDHLFGMTCKRCRRHADKGRKRSVRTKQSGRQRQYSNVNLVLSDRIGRVRKPPMEFNIDRLMQYAFAPDPTDETLYQSQNRKSSNFTDPERRMWRSVLILAMTDLLNPIRCAYHYDALEWVKSEKQSGGSFNFTCETLGIDPSAARSALLRRLAALGGSEAVIPKKEPYNALSHKQRSHRGRKPRRMIICQQPRTATAAGSSSAPMAAPTAAAAISSAPSANGAALTTLPTAVNCL